MDEDECNQTSINGPEGCALPCSPFAFRPRVQPTASNVPLANVLQPLRRRQQASTHPPRQRQHRGHNAHPLATDDPRSAAAAAWTHPKARRPSVHGVSKGKEPMRGRGRGQFKSLFPPPPPRQRLQRPASAVGPDSATDAPFFAGSLSQMPGERNTMRFRKTREKTPSGGRECILGVSTSLLIFRD